MTVAPTKVNFGIRHPQIRVVRDGTQLGIMTPDQARRISQDEGLDLVEIAPQAKPPVCHIMDFAKFKYEQSQKEKEQNRKQKNAANELKEIRLRPNIQDNDIETKLNTIKRFLGDGKKVQLILQFKNREITHKEDGFRVVDKMIADLSSVAVVEKQPKLEGFRITCRLQAK